MLTKCVGARSTRLLRMVPALLTPKLYPFTYNPAMVTGAHQGMMQGPTTGIKRDTVQRVLKNAIKYKVAMLLQRNTGGHTQWGGTTPAAACPILPTLAANRPPW